MSCSWKLQLSDSWLSGDSGNPSTTTMIVELSDSSSIEADQLNILPAVAAHRQVWRVVE